MKNVEETCCATTCCTDGCYSHNCAKNCKQHAEATDAVAITALMSVASQPVIVSIWLKIGDSFQIYESLKKQKQVRCALMRSNCFRLKNKQVFFR